MSTDQYSSLITLGFMSVFLLFTYAATRESDTVDGNELREKRYTLSPYMFSQISSISLWLKLLVGIQTFSLVKTFF